MEELAKKTRIKILKDSFKAGACHIGSALSCVEIVLALENITSRNNGVCLFSKASGAETLYAVKGKTWKYLKNNPLCYPGGSLGHGLPVAVGMALAGRKTYVIVSDAEMQEGTFWESLLFASSRQLRNLTIVIDYNKIQACGKCDDILSLEPLYEKLKAFGCEVRVINDGNDYNSVFRGIAYPSLYFAKPKAVICHTVKGKGISFMENNYHWHYRNLTPELLNQALKELK
jgi:transketolase